ncbi:MAG: type II toxin-antitoxin system Phd/YefM family antitoxin [Anaerolineae bacterium]|nr:type II toxin-antitoxin system Phd/YefM family antitoxin [Anaerolineae bacterium]
MTTIGVRELRQQTGEVLRAIREEKAEYVITYQGEPVAILLPLDAEEVEQAIIEVGKRGAGRGWDAYAQVADRIRAVWPKETDTRSLLDDLRG